MNLEIDQQFLEQSHTPAHLEILNRFGPSLLKVRKLLQENRRDAQIESEQSFAKHAVEKNYQVGDRVYCKDESKTPGTTKKHLPQYSGPYTIVEVSPNKLNVRLCHVYTGKIGKRFIHVNKLKPTKDREHLLRKYATDNTSQQSSEAQYLEQHTSQSQQSTTSDHQSAEQSDVPIRSRAQGRQMDNSSAAEGKSNPGDRNVNGDLAKANRKAETDGENKSRDNSRTLAADERPDEANGSNSSTPAPPSRQTKTNDSDVQISATDTDLDNTANEINTATYQRNKTILSPNANEFRPGAHRHKLTGQNAESSEPRRANSGSDMARQSTPAQAERPTTVDTNSTQKKQTQKSADVRLTRTQTQMNKVRRPIDKILLRRKFGKKLKYRVRFADTGQVEWIDVEQLPDSLVADYNVNHYQKLQKRKSRQRLVIGQR
jgi:hypothetical protein